MYTEYTGSRMRALLLEAGQIPLGALAFRVRWELLRRLRILPLLSPVPKTDARRAPQHFPLEDPSPRSLLSYFRSRRTVRFFFRRSDLAAIRDVWRKRLPAASSKLIDEAERVCGREFSILGVRRVFGPEGVDWHSSVSGPARWPRRHWSTIDIGAESAPGDVKLTWELNRTQFFVTLGRAYALTGETRYARELTALMSSWLSENTFEQGVNWYSNLECALRATSWVFALEMTLDWEGWDADLFAEVVAGLIDHHRHLCRNLVYSQRWMPGNHLIGEAMGLALLSLYLPELPEAERQRRRAVRILLREVPRQILEDGAGAENSTSYHRLVFSMYVLAGLLLERNGLPLPATLWRRLESMCEFMVHLRTPGGAVVQVGDWDDGRAIQLDDSAVEDVTSMLCTGAVLFRRPDFKAVASGFREEPLWLLGADAARVFDDLEPVAVGAPDRPFRKGGIYVWRSEWSAVAEFVLFKCAPFRAHTHADNLSLLYSAGGKDWLVDRGTYVYHTPGGNWPWRAYFRGTRAHNAIVVDGEGQALAHRAFRWLGRPDQRLLSFHAGPRFGFAAAITTAFQRLPDPVLHGRSVLLVRDEYLLVLDTLAARASHRYELFWHLAPAHRMELGDGAVAWSVDASPPNLWIHVAGSSSLEARLAEGEVAPIQGWHSPSYGVRAPAPTLVYRMSSAGPCRFATVLSMRSDLSGGAGPRVSFGAPPSGREELVILRVRGGGFDDEIALPDPGRTSLDRSSPAHPWLLRGGERVGILST